MYSMWLFLVKSDLECSEQERDILGQGGSGTIIYRAKYRGQSAAIKRFHFKKCRQQSFNSSTATITDIQRAAVSSMSHPVSAAPLADGCTTQDYLHTDH
ncbi:hypothetical protein NFI96_008635 [Prochilodus magdalenae]|nr:hypothetical protein NFI96_008635 [Prochilodus magdalenae]